MNLEVVKVVKIYMHFLGFPIGEWMALLGIIGLIGGAIYRATTRIITRVGLEMTRSTQAFVDEVVKPDLIDPIIASMTDLSTRFESNRMNYDKKLQEHEKRLNGHDSQFYDMGWRSQTKSVLIKKGVEHNNEN